MFLGFETRMEKDVPESPYFPHDREQLLSTIARFDDGIRDEDVVDPEIETHTLKQHSNTVLIQVLLEFICHTFVKDENNREKLLIEACKRLSKFKILNDLLIMDKSNELRAAMKYKVISFLKQICEEVIPAAVLNTSAVHLFENDCLSTDLKLYYCTNFIELGKIAQGGFGAVFKAEYKLTKLIYAVKKIPFDYKTDANFLMVMREANNFAALSHHNIVRYFSAWIEMADCESVISLSDDNSTDNSSDEAQEYNGLVIKEKSSSQYFNSLSAIDFENNYNNSKGTDSDSVIFSESVEITNDVNWTVGSYSQSSSDVSDEDSRNDSNYHDENFSHLNFKMQGVLYIQMEFCDCDLRFWLDKRAEGKDLSFEMDVNEIFTHILKGVAHIHSKGIIHRDLKPHNIFYSQSSNAIKIGDFGLATLSGFTADSSDSISHSHSSAIGTIPYAAPEQMKSKKYDMNVDIYSLGVILIELINICTTRAELCHIIKEVKNGKTVDGSNKYPVLGNLAKSLISDNPNDRMSAKDILDLLDKDSKAILKEVIRNEFSEKMKEKEETIRNEFSEKIKEKEETIRNEFAEKIKENEETIRNLNETLKNMQGIMLQQNSEISRLSERISELIVKSEL